MNKDLTVSVTKTNAVVKICSQISLLVWKRYRETTKTKWDLMKILVPVILFYVLMILVYELFSFFSGGAIEPFFVPFAYWIFVQRMVVQITYEKSARLQESMRMMGLSDVAYWTSYMVSDGIIVGFATAFLSCILSTGGLYNSADFGTILGFLFAFFLAVVPFSCFISAFFDTPQTAGQASLALLMGCYACWVVVVLIEERTIPAKSAQILLAFVPPIALQLGCGSFLNSWDGISIQMITGILVADIFIYAILAWYFTQVWPSKIGVRKPWYFIFQASYWFPNVLAMRTREEGSDTAELEMAEVGALNEDKSAVPTEKVSERLLGAPTVVVDKLKKTFGENTVVNNLSFSMYENQIFALLGHNGAGKTTTINMLIGLNSPDHNSTGKSASIYGSSILTEMDRVRYSLGVCPQHDVLFENLTVREHIIFFSQLKGKSYAEAEAEAVQLTNLFHLDSRLDHMGNELSGGQQRKLSVAIAVSGGSKFVVLDEPTAGMDPLARRELWDLLASLRKGRTMLLTTHYMDEADVLGDRIGIMSHGAMQCVGTSQFLKTTYGAGYKLIFDRSDHMDQKKIESLTRYVQSHISEAHMLEQEGMENQVVYALPFHAVKKFGPFFTDLERDLSKHGVTNFGVNITSLEDVFLTVGEDESVTPHTQALVGIGGKKEGYNPNFFSQVVGIAYRRLNYAINDFTTIPLLLLPIGAISAASALYAEEVLSTLSEVNDLATAAIYAGGFIGAPGLIAEFIVRERANRLRNVLTVMGCDFKAYWIGTFIADYILLALPTAVMFISWFAGNLGHYYAGTGGISFLIILIFNAQLLGFSYFFSFVFTTPKSSLTFMPLLVLALLATPNVALLIVVQILISLDVTITIGLRGAIILWGLLLTSPIGAVYVALLDAINDWDDFLDQLPPVGASIAIMLVQTAIFLYATYYVDVQAIAKMDAVEDPAFDARVLENLDSDVQDERDRTAARAAGDDPLRVDRLRKVFQPKVQGRKAVTAVQDISFTVKSGEIFGLLGSNGAGKTTALSMLTRMLVPTSGNAFLTDYSILNQFAKGATHLGVVTQTNSLWDLLTVENHLFLFARIRGVPEDQVKAMVDGTIDQLELTPHRKKLAMRLSGGMKRKLCVAIALIGDPEVVLLDEPSAGLDPVSRRNLWSVILRTMSHRAVILTTHSMDEAEALCQRIGIMVYGQLRALGTKQHLKNKFGSGFELEVKLTTTVDDVAAAADALLEFLREHFPSTVKIGENGGLLTFQIPKEEMKMGTAFTQMEEHRDRLHIEQYSIAQPTLEQVFIRTVHKFPKRDEELLEPLPGLEQSIHDQVLEPTNKCGCVDKTTTKMTVIAFAVFIGFMVIAFAAFGRSNAVGFTIFFLVGIIGLIVSFVGCNLRCCSCCKAPHGIDDE